MGNDSVDLELETVQVERLELMMSRLERHDFDLVDPPERIWAGIAASIAAEPTPPSSGTVVEYCIDADDFVIAVDRDWNAFAQANNAPELAHQRPTQTLWSYFGSDEVRTIWQALVQHVRTSKTEARVSLRCDAPHMRRWFEMTMTPEPDNGVRFQSKLVFEESRPSLPFLSTNVERSSDWLAVPICSWCNKGEANSRWLDIEEVVQNLRLLEQPMPSISYGICPTCQELMASELNSLASRNIHD
ncbi:MAG: hypothetical protein V9E94_05105 [Microthrixaceae bacterium]